MLFHHFLAAKAGMTGYLLQRSLSRKEETVTLFNTTSPSAKLRQLQQAGLHLRGLELSSVPHLLER
jgi:hypothetical protein